MAQSSNNPILTSNVAAELFFRPLEDAEPILKNLANSSDLETWRVARSILSYRLKLPQFHRLYEREEDAFFANSEGPLEIRNLQRSGTPGFIFSGKLLGKVVSRIVPRLSLSKWSQALHATDVWKAAGFDKPPVEEILTLDEIVSEFSLRPVEKEMLSKLEIEQSGEEKVLVYSRIIAGPSLGTLKLSIFLSDLADDDPRIIQSNTIRKTLRSLGLIHGHIHDHNLVVEQKNGVDYLTAIDFDAAR